MGLSQQLGPLLAPVPACLQIHQGNKTVPKPCKALETMPCMVALKILYSANASQSHNMLQFLTQSSLMAVQTIPFVIAPSGQ